MFESSLGQKQLFNLQKAAFLAEDHSIYLL